MAAPPQQAPRQGRLAIQNRRRPRQAEETIPSVRVTRATSRQCSGPLGQAPSGPASRGGSPYSFAAVASRGTPPPRCHLSDGAAGLAHLPAASCGPRPLLGCSEKSPRQGARAGVTKVDHPSKPESDRGRWCADRAATSIQRQSARAGIGQHDPSQCGAPGHHDCAPISTAAAASSWRVTTS